jgi:hypothetical protein
MLARLLLVLTLLLAACSAKHAQTTWTNAHWGMMRSEVSSAVPGLVPGSGDHLVTGATADLRLDKADVAGTALPAEFMFLDGKLQQIMFGDHQYRDNDANAKAFNRMAAVLRGQYGQETPGKTMDPSLGLSRDSTWVSGDTEIVLGLSPVTAVTSSLYVIYRPSGK